MEDVSEHLCWNSNATACCVQQIKCAHKKMWSSGDMGWHVSTWFVSLHALNNVPDTGGLVWIFAFLSIPSENHYAPQTREHSFSGRVL